MTRVTITLDTALADALRADALRAECALSCVARHAFARYFTVGAAACGENADADTKPDAEGGASVKAAEGGPPRKSPKKGGR